jgi:hypothetical protein
MDEDIPLFKCEQCGRRAGKPMLDCPERPLDNCAYGLRSDPHQSWGLGKTIAVLGSMLFVAFYGFSTLRNLIHSSNLRQFIVGIAIEILVLAYFFMIGKKIVRTSTFFSLKKEVHYELTTLFGKEIICKAFATLESLKIKLSSSQFPEIPFSLAILKPKYASKRRYSSEMTYIIQLIKAAIIYLALQGQIRILHQATYTQIFGEKFWRSRSVIWLVHNDSLSKETKGYLEDSILLYLRLTPMLVEDVVDLIIGSMKLNVPNWLLLEVMKDADKQGFGFLNTKWIAKGDYYAINQFEIAPSHKVQLAQQRLFAQDAIAQVYKQFPYLEKALNTQIREAIRIQDEQNIIP